MYKGGSCFECNYNMIKLYVWLYSSGGDLPETVKIIDTSKSPVK